MPVHSSFLLHKRASYFKASVVLSIVCIAAYALYKPEFSHNGGTWLGYTLGVIASLLIVWLTYLGRRKRRFEGGWGTVKGWVSAHVYLGSSLIIIGTLHAGFQFGLNIHTFAYVLMLIVVSSGIYGVWAYRYVPSARKRLKGDRSLSTLLQRLHESDAEVCRLAISLAPSEACIVASAVERTMVGGSLLDQLLARDGSMVLTADGLQSNEGQQALLDWIVASLGEARDKDAETLALLLRRCTARQNLLALIREDIQLLALQDIWRYGHVVFSIALLAALAAHIFAVFFYW